MNKTVNINLAGIFFHIDEDAFLKLQRYLEVIRNSFTDPEGRDEIIADIETRIAELFTEKIKNERQVIGIKEVDEIITIMGQPEDYQVDEDIFEDEPVASTQQRPEKSKQLFRDTSNSYAGGVSSGLSHYMGIDPIWLRILWIILTVSSGGGFIFIYLAFWIFVPEAKTTADYLAMKGEAVNINTIEKKIKEGFTDVAGRVKDMDYQKYGRKVKSGSTAFFDTLTSIVVGLLKVFVKFIGILLIIIAGTSIIGLFIGVVSMGVFGFVGNPATDYLQALGQPNAPIWLLSLLIFFVIGIPLFFLFILGLKIISHTIKSIGNPAKFALLGIWLLSFIGLITFGILQATHEAYDAEIVSDQDLINLRTADTLKIKMVGNSKYVKNLYNKQSFKIKRDENDTKVIVLQDIKIFVAENKEDTIPKLWIRKKAEGNSYKNAKKRAGDIQYDFEQKGTTLLLNGYALTAYKTKYNSQEMELVISIPEGMTLYLDNNTARFISSWTRDEFIPIDDRKEKYLKLMNGKLVCDNCPSDTWSDEDENENNDNDNERTDISSGIHINSKDENTNVKIDENGVKIKTNEGDLQIDENGVLIKSNEIDIRIDESGVNINTDK